MTLCFLTCLLIFVFGFHVIVVSKLLKISVCILDLLLAVKILRMARGDDCCYLCNECPNSFATLDELESHMAEDHLAKKAAQIEQGPSSIKQDSLDGEDGSETKMDLVSGIC